MMDVNITEWHNEIRNYYRTHLPQLPLNPNQRYFKFVWKYPTRHAKHIRDRIYTPEQLQKYLIKYSPQHVYYSLTTWLNPTTVRGRDYSSIPLWSDLVFDVDAGSIKIARKETLKLIRYLRLLGYRKFRVLFTGNKGFHVYVDDFKYEKYPEDPRERVKYFEKVKKKLHEEIISEGIDIDPNLWDLYRVVRVPYTLNATTMLPAVWVKSIKNLHNYGDAIRITKRYPDRPVKIYSTTVVVTSNVLGTSDRHVLFLDLDGVSYDRAVDVAEKLIHEEGMHIVVLFKTYKGYNIWSLSALRFKHVMRLKKKYGDDPRHIRQMKKLGFDTARIREKVFSVGIVHDKPEPMVITLGTGTPKYKLSLGHLLLIKTLTSVDLKAFYRFAIGRPYVKIVPAVAKVDDARFLTTMLN